MKTQINEVKRMQELAGIVKENRSPTPTADPFLQRFTGPDAESFESEFSNDNPDSISVNDPENTADEQRLRLAIEANPLIQARLANINMPSELDGFFKVLLSFTKLKNVSVPTVRDNFMRAINSLKGNNPTITTDKD